MTLPPDGESATVQGALHRHRSRARALFRFKVPTQAGEQVTQNNARDALIEVNDRAREGPLLRRRAALRDASSSAARSKTTRTCRSSILQRTAENKYYRASTSATRDELVGGFPKTREELFAYRGADSRQRRGGVVHARAAADDRRLRQQARRRPADARRPPVVRRRRLGRHAGRRGAAGRARERATPKYFSELFRRGRRAPARRSRSRRSPATRRRRARSGTRCRRCRRVNPIRAGQAGRDGAADRRRQPQAGSDRPRLPALRTRQGDRDADPGLVALADGRRRCRSPTRRTRCSGAGWSAGSSTACPSR